MESSECSSAETSDFSRFHDSQPLRDNNFASLVNVAHLFSVETQDITPGTSPGNSQIGTEVPKPPTYETLDAAVGSLKLRVRRVKLYHKDDSQNVEIVGFWRNTPS